MSTASDRLDSLSPDPSQNQISNLAMEYSDFAIASECGHVVRAESLIDFACPKCGKISRFQLQLFLAEPLELIFNCYKSDRFRQLCILQFCVLIEENLKRLLIARCDRIQIPWTITQILLEKHWRTSERMKLFQRLTGADAKDAFEHAVFDAHKELRTKRNRLAHGFPHASSFRKNWKSIQELDAMLVAEIAPLRISQKDAQTAVNAAAASLSVFATLHDRLCATDSPPIPSD